MDLIEVLQKQMNFCKKEKNYKCGIYAKNDEHRKIVMDVISNIVLRPNKDVELSMGVNYGEVRYKNGSLLKIIRANDNARGYKFNGVIVDNEISLETINCIIIPTLIPVYLKNENCFDRNDSSSDRTFYVDISMKDVYKSRGISNTLCQYQRIFENNNYINFKKEYKSMFYDSPVIEKELNGDKVMLYEAYGIPKDFIKYSTEFVNKTKQTYLNIFGKREMPDLGFKNELNIRLLVDTNIYDGYEVHIEDGLVIVVLHEIKNEAPVLKDYGVVKGCVE